MPLASLRFYLHRQGLERDLEDLGCYFQLLFLLSTKHEMEFIEDIRCGQLAASQRYFSQLEGVDLNVVLLWKN